MSENINNFIKNLKNVYSSTEIKKLSDEDRGYSKNKLANKLIFEDDLAFILGLIFDQSIKSYLAWEAPFILKQRIGKLDVIELSTMSRNEIKEKITEDGKSLHRFPDNMSKYISNSSKIIVKEFNSDAKNLWINESSFYKVKKNLIKLSGIGEKKANLAILMLSRDFNITFSDIRELPLALDVHLFRVLKRSGHFLKNDELTLNPIKANEKIYSLLGFNQAFLSTMIWNIGRKFCHKSNPECTNCPLNSNCKKIL